MASTNVLRSSKLVPCVAIIAFASVVGCNDGGLHGVVMKGRIVEDGKPYKVKDPTDIVYLEFARLEGANQIQNFNADVNNNDLTFMINGPTSQGIPKGTYLLKIQQTRAEWPNGVKSYLPKKLGSDESPLKIEVADETKPITIDVGKEPKAFQ